MVTRRSLLTGAVAAAGAALVPGIAEAATTGRHRPQPRRRIPTAPGQASPVPTPVATATTLPLRLPAAAAEFGMTQLALSTRFDSLASIDLDATGRPGFTWYPRAPWEQKTHGRDVFSIQPDDTVGSYLRIAPKTSNCNWSLVTVDPRTKAGKTHRYGYYAATIRFEPRDTSWIDWDNVETTWPSFWNVSGANATNDRSRTRFGELDIFEALGNDNMFVGTVHDWGNQGKHYRNSNASYHLDGVDFRQWHRFGAIHLPPTEGTTRSRVCWYLDDRFLMVQNYGDGFWPAPVDDKPRVVDNAPANMFDILNSEDWLTVLGSGRDWPMDVAQVSIWTR